MKSSEEELFNYIKQKLPKNVSFIDKIAEVLDLSYDAAYRRVNRKTALNLAETLKLANHYNIDLNTLLLSTNNSKRIIVEKTHHIIEDDFLQTFLDKSSNEIQKLQESRKALLINSLKDYPLYHAGSGFFSMFRIFALINISTKDSNIKKMPFSEFTPSSEILKKHKTFLKGYNKISLTEIWSDSTIDNILNQIQYFFDIGLTTKPESIMIADSLVDSLKVIEEQAKNQKRNHSESSYQLYHNNLVPLLNTVIMKSETQKKIFVPYTNLSYFRISDENTTNQIEQHFKTQIEFSNNLSGDASVERQKFFNTLYQKIENRKTRLSLSFSPNDVLNPIF
ncbi:hypothetical protein H0I29_10335 [Polaribacter sp. R2A056_3_33]|jgi:hypothetical protein|uniref:hypothetical protein n=1 Tax=unclassified Polaribacter TaxID=196858 RepID=UPI001C4FC317|nr:MULTISPECIES: hypothetical protein [unclassified Polaribacter]QXP64439.1 hypothetical protein H0I27_04420 [Polaribacter sp. HaHaR_3_91]QXP69041.1 hypothetical protein H0I29_10335 [Polaribacter sp. R2A056_3_33]